MRGKISMNSLKLKWRIFGFFILFSLFLLVILWLFQTVFLDRFYEHIKARELEDAAKYIEENIGAEDMWDIMDTIAYEKDVCIEIIDYNKKIVYSSEILRDCIIHRMSLTEKIRLLNKATENGNELFEYMTPAMPRFDSKFIAPKESFPKSDRGEPKSLVLVKILNIDNNEVGVIMNSIISPINATVQTLRYQLYFITGIMIFLSVIIAIILAKRVSKPIEEINKSAKTLATGDYNVSFDGKGFLEIKELSNTLNIAANELSKVDSLRKELLANVSHDLRTPLSLIYSYSEMMQDFPEEITAEQIQVIMDETSRLTSLVNDALDISKFETGLQTLNITSFSLTNKIAHVTERVLELVKNQGYEIEFTFDEEVMVKADEVKILQAYYNLLINAINYSGEEKRVIVRQIIIEDRVRIEVENKGEKINEKDIKYIWDRYYKVDKAHKRAVTGTGLGLSIVKNIIDLHKGKYGVETEKEEGSTFWFEIERE